MGLVSFASIESLLTCPRCRAALVASEGGFRCSEPDCALNRRAAFPLVAGRPILVDFERSILQQQEFVDRDVELPPQVAHRWSLDRAPRWLRSWLKPSNDVAARNIQALLSRLNEPVTVLVVGGGTIGNGTERLYSDQRVRVIAFDIYHSPLTQFVADTHAIPLADGSVDAVVVQAVLEHVLDPEQAVGEIWRVLRANGLVYAETPFLQQVHAGPYDFVRFTSSGHRYLFRKFEEIASGPVAGPGTQMLWSIDHLLRGLLRSELAGKLARGVLFGLRYLDRVIPDSYAMDDASAYYFLGERSARELTPQEIIGYYRGAQRTLSDSSAEAPH
jgi:SAM-dependent methyltransferase